MKEITLQIPEGKKAKWINGVLTLVDDKPKDITERIKTFEDACYELGDEHQYVKAYREWMRVSFAECEDVTAYLKLRVICAALNEGWVPRYTGGEKGWSPYFIIETGNGGRLCCSISRSLPSAATAYVGSRLCLKSEALATYCGKQFIDIWKDYLLIKND